MLGQKVILEKKADPHKFTPFFMTFWGTGWTRHRRYESVDQALQAYEGLMKSSWHHKFDWRIQAEVGTIDLPVVRA